jgi:hypothetical protein
MRQKARPIDVLFNALVASNVLVVLILFAKPGRWINVICVVLSVMTTCVLVRRFIQQHFSGKDDR